jgi:hypothetical protein
MIRAPLQGGEYVNRAPIVIQMNLPHRFRFPIPTPLQSQAP